MYGSSCPLAASTAVAVCLCVCVYVSDPGVRRQLNAWALRGDGGDIGKDDRYKRESEYPDNQAELVLQSEVQCGRPRFRQDHITHIGSGLGGSPP